MRLGISPSSCPFTWDVSFIITYALRTSGSVMGAILRKGRQSESAAAMGSLLTSRVSAVDVD